MSMIEVQEGYESDQDFYIGMVNSCSEECSTMPVVESVAMESVVTRDAPEAQSGKEESVQVQEHTGCCDLSCKQQHHVHLKGKQQHHLGTH